MPTARLFRNGRSQAVRIPKELEFSGAEVTIIRAGHGLYLTPVDSSPWGNVRAVHNEHSAFPKKLSAAPEQERDMTW
jgi:antitoxin VapB